MTDATAAERKEWWLAVMQHCVDSYPAGSKVRKIARNLYGGVRDVYVCFNLQFDKYGGRDKLFINSGTIPICLSGRDPSGLELKHPSYLVGTLRDRVDPPKGTSYQQWIMPKDTDEMDAFFADLKSALAEKWQTTLLPMTSYSAQIQLLRRNRTTWDKDRLAIVEAHLSQQGEAKR